MSLATPGVDKGGIPCRVVRVEVTEDKRVVVSVVEDRRQVRAMLAVARRRRRHVNVEDADVRLVELDLDGLEFDVRVGVE